MGIKKVHVFPIIPIKVNKSNYVRSLWNTSFTFSRDSGVIEKSTDFKSAFLDVAY